MFDYRKADRTHSQPEVRMAVERFRRLPLVSNGLDKRQDPLLYWLLGSGTPNYKMSKRDSVYGPPPPGTAQRCSNCASAYQNVVSGVYICSQIAGTIEPHLWCAIWNQDRN
jgi:hypothetical protein